MTINYQKPLKFLEEYGGKPYKDPDRDTMKKAGQDATGELKKIVKLCNENFHLCQSGRQIRWLTTNGQKIKGYLWVQLKYKDRDKNPVSISIVVEKPLNTSKPRFRFCLELNDNDAKEGDREKFHSHLEIDKPDDLEYFSAGGGTILSQSPEELREEIKKNFNLKVQIGRVVEDENELTNENIEQVMLDAIGKLIPFYEYVIGKNNPEDNQKDGGESMKKDDFDKNMILYGPPGTGKTYNTAIYAVAICNKKFLKECENSEYSEIMDQYKKLQEQDRIAFTTFHQSYGYEEFIEGIKPVMKGEQTSDIKYEIKAGIFKEFCKKAGEDKDNNYVFIIDEINRGNISKIFGELITLIEDTKREGRTEEMYAKLPCSQTDFSVPNNVYIIGTMNTADRSIALMDTALRRRFQFIEMMPNYDKLLNDVTINNQKLDIKTMLETINKRIECLYDREHTIGHALFMGLTKKSDINDLKKIFEKSLIPLLQEYFYEDYQKIRLVLGDNNKTNESHRFIKAIKIDPKEIFKGVVDIDLPETRYELNKDAFDKIESYIKIYSPDSYKKTDSTNTEKESNDK